MSSGSEIDACRLRMDQKKRRMESNRESARRSRIKKQKHMEDLVNEIGFLQKEISKNSSSCDTILQNSQLIESENSRLRDEHGRLEQQLRSLEWMVMNFDQADCLDDSTFAVQEPYSWQVHGLPNSIIGLSGHHLVTR